MSTGQKPAYFTDLYSSTPGRNFVDIKYTCGSSGAVPTFPGSLDLAAADMVSNVALSGTGVLTVTLLEAWERVINFSGNILQASYSASGACGLKLTTDNSGTAATRTLVFTFLTAAGAAVNPAQGDIVMLTIVLQSVAP